MRIRRKPVFAACLVALLCSTAMLLQIAHGEEPHTPLAGQEHRTEMSGQDVFVPARDRRHVTAVNFGLQWLPHGPTPYEVLPFGALFVWRSSYDDTERFRGTFSGLVNDVKYNIGLP